MGCFLSKMDPLSTLDTTHKMYQWLDSLSIKKMAKKEVDNNKKNRVHVIVNKEKELNGQQEKKN